jgi:hypothetical protein
MDGLSCHKFLSVFCFLPYIRHDSVDGGDDIMLMMMMMTRVTVEGYQP